MDGTFARASFDATLDDLVEVSLRHYRASREARRTRRNVMLASGSAIGVLVLLVASPLWSRGDGVVGIPLIAVALAAAIGFLSGYSHDDSTRKHTRRYIAEQLGGARDVYVEVEISSSDLWVRHS